MAIVAVMRVVGRMRLVLGQDDAGGRAGQDERVVAYGQPRLLFSRDHLVGADAIGRVAFHGSGSWRRCHSSRSDSNGYKEFTLLHGSIPYT
jgi:hypothetical protein